MRHFRDFAPDAALPDYTGRVFEYEHDMLGIEINGLKFDLCAKIECHGESDGRFFPVSAVVEDAYGNSRKLSLRNGGGAGSTPLRDAVIEGVEADWDDIERWCCEQAEDE